MPHEGKTEHKQQVTDSRSDKLGYVVSKEERLPGKKQLKNITFHPKSEEKNVTPVIFTIPSNKTSVPRDLKRVERDKLSKRHNSRPNTE